MSSVEKIYTNSEDHYNCDVLFELIANDLEQQGYSIHPGVLPEGLMSSLFLHLQEMDAEKFKNAGIGRSDDYIKNKFVRTDEICWITGNSDAGKQWLKWTTALQHYLNQRLFLGLFSFESHFSHYGCGDYYKRHYDAFRGEANRVLSIVAYLNSDWTADDGGELVIYKDDHDKEGVKVVPLMGTFVAFLSEEFPHEVLMANRDRYAVAGWFRINTSINNNIDPPR